MLDLFIFRSAKNFQILVYLIGNKSQLVMEFNVNEH